ncbi:hypothetical protein OF83DRAFT_1163669 [Amylostereum chailletii]|nr:hypothetical protein OF83DRAFT_1163669 [Amylostereum chailletii]
MSKVVFVGNVPYNYGEEQLIDVFKSVGQVVGFRLVFDRETGKPRGYGFCEFADHETALSAVRNLNNADVGGRPLRIDLADSDPFLEGKTTVRGELVDSGNNHAGGPTNWNNGNQGFGGGGYREYDNGPRNGAGGKELPAFMRSLPPGMPVPPGMQVLDMISQNLASINPQQLVEVLAQMKAFVITHPDQARTLLISHPQLAYALFQALLLNKIVDPAILQRMLSATAGSSGPAASQPPPPQAPVAPQPHLAAQSMPPAVAPFQHQLQHPPPPFYNTPPPIPTFYAAQPPPGVPRLPVQPTPPIAPAAMAPTPMPVAAPAPTAGGGTATAIEGLSPQARVGNLLTSSKRDDADKLCSACFTPEQIAQYPPNERDTMIALRTQLGGLASSLAGAGPR